MLCCEDISGFSRLVIKRNLIWPILDSGVGVGVGGWLQRKRAKIMDELEKLRTARKNAQINISLFGICYVSGKMYSHYADEWGWETVGCNGDPPVRMS